jgi:hypothetical protein
MKIVNFLSLKKPQQDTIREKITELQEQFYLPDLTPLHLDHTYKVHTNGERIKVTMHGIKLFEV